MTTATVTNKFTDKHFQEVVVQAMIVDNGYAEQMLEVLNLEYFNLEYLKTISRIMFDYYKKFKTFPSFKLLVTITKDELTDDALKEQIIRIPSKN